jgi:hypothetical protein
VSSLRLKRRVWVLEVMNTSIQYSISPSVVHSVNLDWRLNGKAAAMREELEEMP